MISRNSEGGFFAAHWDWLVAGAGLAALAVGVVMFVTSGGTDPDENAGDMVRRLMADKKSETGVKPVEMAQFERTLQLASKPPVVAEVAADGGSFLVSPKRVFCALCHKPIPGDAKKCPLCKGDQPEPEKVALDTDGDGLPDWWEKKFGLDAATADADADTDADGFTNAEEFAAGTDPSDKKSHPDYFDSLKLVMPLKETYLPFYLRSYMKTPAGMRLEFFDPKRRNDYGKSGYRYSVLVGEPVGDTGFVAKGFEQKERKQKIPGSNVERSVDVSEATITRKSDGKTLVVSLVEKRTPVETQATIAFSRGEPSEFTATAGKTFKLYESTYKVIDIKSVGKGAKVTIEDPLGKIRTLEAVDR